MEQLRADIIADRRFTLILVGVFAALALVLGIYRHLWSYLVLRSATDSRDRIRTALGASPRRVLGMVVGDGAKLAIIGIAIGTVGALVLTQFIRAFLYSVSPSDPLTFTGIALILGAVAILASSVPARRAMKVDPNTALRCE